MRFTFIFHATIASNIFLSNFLNTVFFHEIFRSFRFSLKFWCWTSDRSCHRFARCYVVWRQSCLERKVFVQKKKRNSPFFHFRTRLGAPERRRRWKQLTAGRISCFSFFAGTAQAIILCTGADNKLLQLWNPFHRFGSFWTRTRRMGWWWVGRLGVGVIAHKWNSAPGTSPFKCTLTRYTRVSSIAPYPGKPAWRCRCPVTVRKRPPALADACSVEVSETFLSFSCSVILTRFHAEPDLKNISSQQASPARHRLMVSSRASYALRFLHENVNYFSNCKSIAEF